LEKIERVKVKIIKQPPESNDTLPFILRWDNDKTPVYIPNISELATHVKLSDWIFICSTLTVDGTLLRVNVNVIFTVKDDIDLKRHHEDLAAGPAHSVNWEENLIPHGDFFIMRRTDDHSYSFLNMPPVAEEILRAEPRELIERDEFRNGLQWHKRLKENKEAYWAQTTNTRWTGR
jgi:hypothetical protein